MTAGPTPPLLRRLLGAPYGALMRLRRSAYAHGLLPSRAVAVPVFCVGNLTTGGTGKTPMVAWLVAQLQQLGRRPAILTRGYKARDGMSDEARLLEQLTGGAVVVNPDRLAGARHAIANGADVLVMDDGFQHLRLRRDLDVVLLDATNPFGGGTCLPAGHLREPADGLARATAVVLTRTDQVSPADLDALQTTAATLAPHATLLQARHAPASAIDPADQPHQPETLAGRKLFAFCGLGNPGAFFSTLESLGAEIVGRCCFGDHAAYPQARLAELDRLADQARAEFLVTTQKDAVKIARDGTHARQTPAGRPIWQLAVRMELTNAQALLDIIRTTLTQSKLPQEQP
jgi:tetraacyldisaccharide 4'-kinase